MIIDLTHTLHKDIIVFPGTPQPRFQQIASIPFDGFNEKLISFASHTGTHMDAPNHILADTKTLDIINPEQFLGKARVIDSTSSTTIDTKLIENYIKLIDNSDFVLFYTGWEKLWGSEEYLKNFPTLTEEAANRLAKLNLKGIGLDTISVDPVDSQELPIHKILLSSGLLIIENLTNLSQLPRDRTVDFIALPLKIKEADGSPIRAIAIV